MYATKGQHINIELTDEIAASPVIVLSNEPGLYREGEYGIRTENLILCIEKETTGFGKFLGFETLTLCPIDTKLNDSDLLDKNEIDWLNNYHKEVRKLLKPIVRKELHTFLDELTDEIYQHTKPHLKKIIRIVFTKSPSCFVNLQSLMPMVKTFRTTEQSDNWSIKFFQSE